MPQSEKYAVEVEYGMPARLYRRTIVIDHIVLLELGGSNDIANLFPEPGDGLVVEWETDEQRMERCDHEGTSEPLQDAPSVTACSACGKTWPTRFGTGAPTVRRVSKQIRPAT